VALQYLKSLCDSLKKKFLERDFLFNDMGNAVNIDLELQVAEKLKEVFDSAASQSIEDADATLAVLQAIANVLLDKENRDIVLASAYTALQHLFGAQILANGKVKQAHLDIFLPIEVNARHYCHYMRELQGVCGKLQLHLQTAPRIKNRKEGVYVELVPERFEILQSQLPNSDGLSIKHIDNNKLGLEESVFDLDILQAPFIPGELKSTQEGALPSKKDLHEDDTTPATSTPNKEVKKPKRKHRHKKRPSTNVAQNIKDASSGSKEKSSRRHRKSSKHNIKEDVPLQKKTDSKKEMKIKSTTKISTKKKPKKAVSPSQTSSTNKPEKERSSKGHSHRKSKKPKSKATKPVTLNPSYQDTKKDEVGSPKDSKHLETSTQTSPDITRIQTIPLDNPDKKKKYPYNLEDTVGNLLDLIVDEEGIDYVAEDSKGNPLSDDRLLSDIADQTICLKQLITITCKFVDEGKSDLSIPLSNHVSFNDIRQLISSQLKVKVEKVQLATSRKEGLCLVPLCLDNFMYQTLQSSFPGNIVNVLLNEKDDSPKLLVPFDSKDKYEELIFYFDGIAELKYILFVPVTTKQKTKDVITQMVSTHGGDAESYHLYWEEKGNKENITMQQYLVVNNQCLYFLKKRALRDRRTRAKK